MKKFMMFSGVFVALVIVMLNISLSMSGSKMLADVRLAFIETMALADSEIPGGGAESGTLTPGGCAITEKVIVGHNTDGPIYEIRVYPGEFGQCAGSDGSCSPYKCTKLAF